MANHDVWDAIAATDGTPAQGFEMLLDIVMPSGQTVTTADVADLNPAFTAKTRARNTYASKGVDQALKYGDNLVLTWNHEPVRDLNGEYQPELRALIEASRKNGRDNILTLRVYDSLGADYAFEAQFAISVTLSGTGWDDKRWYAITATQYTPVEWITNPVLTGNVPVLSSAAPSGADAGDTVFLQGRNFTGVNGASAVKFGANAGTNATPLSDTLLSVTVPAGTAGDAPITVTNAAGTSEPLPYTRGA
jgi:hypothetical protein